MALDATAVAEKWATRTGAAGPDYEAGVMNTSKDPTQLAIAAGARYIANVQARYQDGTWANRLRAAGKTGWQNAVRDRGVTNFTNGVAKSKDKVAAAFAPLLSYIDSVQREVQAMPNTTDAERDQRMLRNVARMRQYRKPGA